MTSVYQPQMNSAVSKGSAIVPLTDHKGRGRFVSMIKPPQGMLMEACCPCSFIMCKDGKPNPDIGKIAKLERIAGDQNSLASATENGEIDLVRAIASATERQ
jgi:hypothetical protein